MSCQKQWKLGNSGEILLKLYKKIKRSTWNFLSRKKKSLQKKERISRVEWIHTA